MLYKYIEQCGKKEFQWGTFDCCTFACDWAIKLGKNDPMHELRGKYKTALGALRLLKKISGADSIRDITDFCDADGTAFHRVPKEEVGRGDVVIVSGIPFGGDGAHMDCSMGICVGDVCAVASEKGVVYVNRMHIVMGWND